LYLAYNAPHWPLQAKPTDIARFNDRYKVGWDVIRQERLARQEKMGLIDKGQSLSARDKRVRPWLSLSAGEQDSTAYRMAVYAAQISSLDENVGKLVASLKKRSQFDNTLILFLSDNGACAETYNELGSSPMSLINNPDFSGPASYGIGWANASNTPFFEYKVKSYEGGIRAPLIAHFPTKIRATRGRILTTKGHVTDLMPTILELTGATYPGTFHDGQSIFPLEGRSLMPALQTGKQADPAYMYWEHEWYGAVRKGDWKAVHDLKKGTWELYNLAADRIESKNEAQNQTALLADLQQHWQQWATSHAVVPKRLN
ncbi:MAG: arylsulfatase, partial [Cytophagaceae bacterium]